MEESKLKSFVERIEKLEEEKKNLSNDIKDVYNETKSAGYEPKIIKQVIKIRAKSKQEFEEEQDILDTYLKEVGEI